MCLIIKENTGYSPFAITADNETTCYKVLVVSRSNDLVTPFQDCIVCYGGSNVSSKSMVPDYFGIPKWCELYEEWQVEHGIHTFKTLERAKSYIDDYYDYFDGMHIVIYECVIPKGIYYYEGNVNGDYCSEKITFIKPVEEIKEYHIYGISENYYNEETD